MVAVPERGIKRCLEQGSGDIDKRQRCLEQGSGDIDRKQCSGTELSYIDQKTCNVVLGAQFLNACKGGDFYEALEILQNVRSFECLDIRDYLGKTALHYARVKKMYDVASAIEDKRISYLITACYGKDLTGFTYIYGRIGHKQILNYKRYSDGAFDLISETRFAVYN